MARTQWAGTPKRCEASAINEAHERDVVVALFCVAFPAIATSEQDRSPSAAMAKRDAIIPTGEKRADVLALLWCKALLRWSEGPPGPELCMTSSWVLVGAEEPCGFRSHSEK